MSGPLVNSFKVAATLASQRVVCGNGTQNTVGYPAATSKLPFGVTVDDVKDTNQAIPVQQTGIAKVVFNDTCASGAQVGFDTNGYAVPVTLGAAATTTGAILGILGTLVGPSVAATGTVAEVLLQPHLMR